MFWRLLFPLFIALAIAPSGHAAPAVLAPCEVVTAKRSGPFQIEAFQQALAAFRESAPEASDLSLLVPKPEKLLALLETLSPDQRYSGFRFDELVNELGPKELKKLHKLLLKAAPDGKISVYDFQNFLKKLHRLFHKPESFWWALAKTRSLAKARDQVERQKLREELELSLFDRGLEDAFAAIIEEPSLRARVTNYFKRTQIGRERLLAAGSWLLALSAPWLHPELQPAINWYSWTIYLPPYIPGFGRALPPQIGPADLQAVLDRDIDDALEAVHAAQVPLQRSYRRYWWARSLYASGVTVAIGFTFAVSLIESIQIENQRAGEAKLKHYQETSASFDALVEMSPEQQGEADFQRLVDDLRGKGLEVDLNSPDMIQERANRIKAYVEVTAEKAEALKTKTGDASSATPAQLTK